MNAQPAAGPVVVSVHDIAPGTAAQTLRWLADLDARGIPATLLLVPGLWRGRRLAGDPEFVAAVLEAGERGHELALHGLHHRAVPGQGPLWRRGVAQVMARGAAEFATLPQAEATARLREGLEELAAIGVTPIGFHPPGWLISPDGVSALRSCGLRYYSTHLAVHTIPAQESADVSARIAAPALSHRPGGFGERFGVRLMTGAARRYARTGRAFRIALHPDDLAHAGLREATLRAIDEAVELGARPTTYAQLLARVLDPVDS
ncbi:polysaccharide deacetylase family protein [Actinospica durhamensis]|uniref:Polysaccharide deacetylase family protein n=1 Tax=Actinospica durhamensis TaxID=1508375 RepID=A0A941EVW7_9ACTN|nr:polysaccharide deacetylase family protein [Actinospica durhamensis]MBR7837337.1 polysaccharide deacetylase family protein [Actinospica durhamensis]